MTSSRLAKTVAPCWIAALLACGAPAPVASDAPARAELPATLRETGLYADGEGRTLADDVVSFAPQYPLWTDGAEKSRFLALPAGASIDASDPEAWRFPVGTRLWKEFRFGRRIETRYMELAPEGWRYATYVWSEDGREATLAPEAGVEIPIDGGVHSVPSRADCVACHANGPVPVLGFSLLQLSPDRDPLAPHAEPTSELDLRTASARGILTGLPPALLATPPRIDAPTPIARAALGYLHGNCSSCHREDGLLAALGMRLGHAEGAAVEPALTSTVGVESTFRDPRHPDAHLRIHPGSAEGSVLFLRASSRDPFVQMPPIGTHRADTEALALLRAFIDGLDPRGPSPTSGEPK